MRLTVDEVKTILFPHASITYTEAEEFGNTTGATGSMWMKLGTKRPNKGSELKEEMKQKISGVLEKAVAQDPKQVPHPNR